jgi:hypothetical protein
MNNEIKESKLNEGQTQVYSDGSVVPQAGVDTNVPYLNTPPKQLLDLTAQFFQGGRSEAKVLAILVGMGIPQQLALSSIAAHKAIMGMYNENHNKQKNHNKMNFTLAQLYENVMKSIDTLKLMESDQSRVSYSAKNALNILEESLDMFPRQFYQSFVAAYNNGKEESTSLSENLEAGINPNLKFKIAKTLHRNLAIHEWLAPVRSLRDYIDEVYNNTKWSFRISEAIERNESQKGSLYENLVKDLTETLVESESVKANLSKVSIKYPWSKDIFGIVNEMAIEDRKAVSNNGGVVSSVLSPVIENENGLNFFLHGKTYSLKDGKIAESIITDQRFFNVLEGLKLFKHTNESLVIFGQNDKSLEYNLTEGKLTLGNSDLSELNPTQIKEALLATNFFGYKNFSNADVVAKFFESAELLYEMDNFTNISSKEFLALYLTMIAVEEGVWVNKVNTGMQLNEMTFIPSATEAVKTIKEFINYDASTILSEKLISEGNETAKISKKRNEISETISFLEDKKVKISEAISKIGKSEELDEALNLINAEISKFEKELQETYSIVEKKTRNQYLDQGFVEATIENPVSGFKVDTMVYVNAEEYASLGDNDMLTFIDPKNDKSYICKKRDLKVKL